MYRLRRRISLNNLSRAQLVARLAFLMFIGSVIFTLVATVVFAYYAKELPRPDKIVRREGYSTKIYDRNGELLYDVFADKRRTPVTFEQVPDYLKQATISIEDKNFYKHGGFDPLGMLRAFYYTIRYHRLQSGSTLTQQLVKNVLLSSEQTLPRKIKEFILTVQIENKYSKDEILQMYMNEAPYGGVTWGVETASETYFGKKVDELNLVECAILAGLPQRPSYYSPYSDTPKAYVQRTTDVLRRMREDGYIKPEQEKEALAALPDYQFSPPNINFKAPHFVTYVKKLLEDRYGQGVVENGGLRVYTTLDLKVQENAQRVVAEEIAKVENVNITNGAAMIVDPADGEILGMVGSKNFDDPNYDGQVNVTTMLRQPGSTIKPVTYVTAFKKGYTPATLLMDTPAVFPIVNQPDYKPVNYDGKFHGPIQVRQALGNSLNIPAVKMLARVGIKDMLQTGFDMGLTTLEPTPDNMRRFGLSVTLGGGEVRLLDLAEAYCAFANGGNKVEPVAILKVTDKDGHVLDEHHPMAGKQVVTPEQAFLISHILADNNARLITFGEHNSLVIPNRMVAVKTGTTNDRRDNWTIGWTPQVMVGVWVGNNDNSQMKQLASGVTGAAPIWRRIIMDYLTDKPVVAFEQSSNVVTADIDTISGYKAHDGYSSRLEYFIKGTEPSGDDPVHAKLKVCRGQDKLATTAQVGRGDYDEKEYLIFKEDDPVSMDGKNRWQDGINEWLASQSDSKYRPPNDYCGDQNDLAVIIREPSDHQQVDSNEVKVRGEVVTNNDIDKVEILVNNQVKDTANSSSFEKVINLDKGTYTIKVRAIDKQGKQSESEVRIGVKEAWDWTPPTPTPTPIFSPTLPATSSPTPH